MRNYDQKSGGDGGPVVPRPGRGSNGIIPTSFKAISNYLRIVSSGASTAASTVRSAASAASGILERDSESTDGQVCWAGFDKLEVEGGITRQVLLLGYGYGFQVWDVEETANLRNLVYRHDGPVSFMQMLPRPMTPKQSGDRFADSRPLLSICVNGSFSRDNNNQEGFCTPCNGPIQHCHGSLNDSCVRSMVWFYSLRSQSYVHCLKFRSVVHLVRCSSRVVSILQSTQIHCVNAATLEREYIILTNPIIAGCGPGNIGVGPLAVGPRWMAYSGSAVAISNSGRVSPQHLTSSASFPSPSANGSLVAHYAKESSKQLATGIVTLGDMGYKKLSRYYSELVSDCDNMQSGNARVKEHGAATGHFPDTDNVGMVIVRDIVTRTVITQFKAHKSPILSLFFDPSGTLLVTASVQGHNINVFRIMPGLCGSSSSPSCVHIYRLQRGFTNAVIQDISFSADSQWILISSSRGTGHLFSISPSGGSVSFQSTNACTRNGGSSLMTESTVHGPPNSGLQVLTEQSVCVSGPPIMLSAVSRIRNGNSGWKSTVSGAAAAATGRMSSLSGAIASAFHNFKVNDLFADASSLEKNYSLMVFSPSGWLIQYALRLSPAVDSMISLPGASATGELSVDCDARLAVQAIQKWNICQKQYRKEREDNINTYGENKNSDSSKVFPERMRQENSVVTTTKDNITATDRHHMYISKAELQTHQSRNPLWSRSEIYFQSMLAEGCFNIGKEGAREGEIEIERIPVRIFEARSKNLVPVYDYLKAPKFQQGRIPIMNRGNNGQPLYQESDAAADGKLTYRSSSGSVNSTSNVGIVMAESSNDAEETGQDGLQVRTETNHGFVNANDTAIVNAGLETVNTRETRQGVLDL